MGLLLLWNVYLFFIYNYPNSFTLSESNACSVLEVLTVVSIKVAVFWVVAPRRMV
jgi:hypothetical protein